MMELLIKAKLYAEELLGLKAKAMSISPSTRLCNLAKSKLGTDFTNDQIVPDEVSCAYAVSYILRELDPDFPIIPGTNPLWRHFQNNADKFERVYEPKAGDIVICATGTGSRPQIIPNGHTGIYLDDFKIMSNSSHNGLWEVNFNRNTWRDRYWRRGGYAIYLYRIRQ